MVMRCPTDAFLGAWLNDKVGQTGGVNAPIPTLAWALLFAEFVSGSNPEADAVFTAVPCRAARATIVTVTLRPDAIVPREHRIGSALEQLPWLVVTDTSISCDG